MSQSQDDTSTEMTFQSIMAALLTCYGSLEEPNFRGIYPQLSNTLHRQVIDELEKEKIDVTDTTDTNDDVSNQLFVFRGNDEVSLGLSGVGPFATVIHHGPDGRRLWITDVDDTSAPLVASVVSAVKRAGFQLLDRDTVAQTISMNRADGSVEATLYQALFTDSDIIP